MRLLAQREHSRAELQRKLARHLAEDDLGQIPPLLDELEAKGWLSEARTVEAVVQSKASRFGIRKVEQALRARRLPSDLVQQALARARESELDRARTVWRKKFGAAPADANERARQHRFLAGRGFETDTIQRLLREVADGIDSGGGPGQD